MGSLGTDHTRGTWESEPHVHHLTACNDESEQIETSMLKANKTNDPACTLFQEIQQMKVLENSWSQQKRAHRRYNPNTERRGICCKRIQDDRGPIPCLNNIATHNQEHNNNNGIHITTHLPHSRWHGFCYRWIKRPRAICNARKYKLTRPDIKFSARQWFESSKKDSKAIKQLRKKWRHDTCYHSNNEEFF